MKIKIYKAVTDGGDGEYHPTIHKSMKDLMEYCGIEELEDTSLGFDEYGYPVQISEEIFDTDGYEVVG